MPLPLNRVSERLYHDSGLPEPQTKEERVQKHLIIKEWIQTGVHSNKFCMDPKFRTDGLWGCINKFKARIENCENKLQMSLQEAPADLCPESQFSPVCLDIDYGTNKAK